MKKILLVLGVIALVSAIPVKAVDYGGQPNLDNSWKPLPTCDEAKPKAPILYEPNNPALPKAKNSGEVRLQWTKVPQASGYNVLFGLSPRNYIYSAVGLGDVDNYTVRFLGNRTYYFAVQSKGSCATSLSSNEWAARPGGGGVPFVTTAFVPVQREAVVENAQPEQVQPEQNVKPQAPRLVPPAPVAPKPAASQGFFQSIFSFFGRLFGGK